jgi:raffinose/stachyose/melibiose transport system substrate-binding protein
MLEQIRAGFCQDITNAIAGDFKESFYPAGVQAFMSQGKSYGLPDSAGPNVFWYNKDLCEKAGVDPNEIKYWEDLLDAVKKCKAAGVTPMAVGGSEKWPLHFYPALLMMRILGRKGWHRLTKVTTVGLPGWMSLKPGRSTKSYVIWIPSKRDFRQRSLTKRRAFSTTARPRSISRLASGF